MPVVSPTSPIFDISHFAIHLAGIWSRTSASLPRITHHIDTYNGGVACSLLLESLKPPIDVVDMINCGLTIV